MLKRILNITFWVLVSIGSVVLWGFALRENGRKICEQMDIRIDTEKGMNFLSNEDVVIHLRNKNVYPVGMKIEKISVRKIEEALEEIPEVKDAEVYCSVSGKVGVNIEQRVPVVRVFNLNGRSFYIDEDGKQMALSPKYFPRVLTVTGFVNEPLVEVSVGEIEKDSVLADRLHSDEIFRMAMYIRSKAFWNAQIQEIHFQRNGDMDLIPLMGDHRIIFGNVQNMEKKFNKLYLFYKDGISKTGWNKYDTINLKYKNQIVCTKK